jgi:hypothetical protein
MHATKDREENSKPFSGAREETECIPQGSHPVCNIPILNYQVQIFLSPQPPVLPVLNLPGRPIMFHVRWKSAHNMDILDKKLVIQENFSPAHKLLIFTSSTP